MMSSTGSTSLSTSQIVTHILSWIAALAALVTGIFLFISGNSAQLQVQVDANDGTITEASEYYQRLIGAEGSSSVGGLLIAAGTIGVVLSLIALTFLLKKSSLVKTILPSEAISSFETEVLTEVTEISAAQDFGVPAFPADNITDSVDSAIEEKSKIEETPETETASETEDTGSDKKS